MFPLCGENNSVSGAGEPATPNIHPFRPRGQECLRHMNLLFLREEAGAVVNAFAFEDYPGDAFGDSDVFQRVAVDD